jgi:hypothetical protein
MFAARQAVKENVLRVREENVVRLQQLERAWRALQVVVNAEVLLEHSGQHLHAVPGLAVLEIRLVLVEAVEVALGFKLNVLGLTIKCLQTLLYVELLRATQSFGTQQVHQRDVHLRQVLIAHREKFREACGLAE